MDMDFLLWSKEEQHYFLNNILSIICAMPASPEKICAQTAIDFNDAMKTLSTKLKKTIILRFGKNVSVADCAKELGCSEDEVLRYTALALRLLRHPSRSKKLKAYF